MPYVAHLCSSSTLGCRGAERPSAAQRRGAPKLTPKRRAAPRGAPRSTVLQRRGAAERRTGALRRHGTQSAHRASQVEPVNCLSSNRSSSRASARPAPSPSALLVIDRVSLLL